MGIANELLAVLPSGKRFVDLCGGGGAMSHAAALSGKFESVLYVEKDKLVADLFRDAIAGKYRYEVFKPPFVTREEFFRRMGSDGYVKIVWSFGSGGDDYIYGRKVEPYKHAAHDLIVFGKPSDLLEKTFPGVSAAVTATDIRERRMQFKRFVRSLGRLLDAEALERAERVATLEHLSRNQGLANIERVGDCAGASCVDVVNADMTDYVYRDGDVVYIDPPYETAVDRDKSYDKRFESEPFYGWVASRDYPAYFSSYEISDKRFAPVWSKSKRVTFCSQSNRKRRTEYLYANGAARRQGLTANS